MNQLNRLRDNRNKTIKGKILFIPRKFSKFLELHRFDRSPNLDGSVRKICWIAVYQIYQWISRYLESRRKEIGFAFRSVTGSSQMGASFFSVTSCMTMGRRYIDIQTRVFSAAKPSRRKRSRVVSRHIERRREKYARHRPFFPSPSKNHHQETAACRYASFEQETVLNKGGE